MSPRKKKEDVSTDETKVTVEINDITKENDTKATEKPKETKENIKTKADEIVADTTNSDQAAEPKEEEKTEKTKKKTTSKKKTTKKENKKAEVEEVTSDKDEIKEEESKKSDSKSSTKKKKTSKSKKKATVKKDEKTTLKKPDKKPTTDELLRSGFQYDTESKEFESYIYHTEEEGENEKEKYLTLKRLQKMEVPIPVTLISFITINGVLHFKGIPPAPYDNFTIYIPVRKSFFLQNEIVEGRPIDNRNELQLKDVAKYYLAATVHVVITSLIYSTHNNIYTIYGSRVKAMELLEHKYYVKGILNKEKKIQKIHNGIVVNHCNVIRVTKTAIEVEVAGVAAYIDKKELSYDFLDSPSDKFSVGDYIDVLVEEITYNKHPKGDYRTLKCSVKKAETNPTLPALHKALKSKELAVGVVVGASTEKVRYYIRSLDGGYNVIADVIETEKRLADSLYKTNYGKKPIVGSTVLFRPLAPYKYDEEIMYARIVRVIKQ